MTGKSNQRTWVVISIVLMAFISPALARTIYVPADFNNIQAAIDDSNDGDTIIVADGTYTGDGNRDIDFLGKAITLRSENGPENCIIDCNGTWTEHHRGFYFHSGENGNSIVDGFTITNGYATDGGGINCCYSSSPIISNCVIMRNKVANNGGGIYCRDSSPTLTNCTFNDNWNDTIYIDPPEDLRGCGVGMCNYENSSPILSNCTFSRNMPAIGGGGIVNYLGSNPTLTNCIFNDNWAEFGGGMCNVESSPTLTNCTFSNNDADWGSGLINLQFSSPTVTNCILWDGGDEIQNYGSTITITYSDVQGGSTGIYLDPNSTLNWELGNIDADPCFADVNNGDYHLRTGSTCINAGDPNYVAAPNEIDLDGKERVLGGRIDMGAYEFMGPTIYVDVNAPGPTYDGSSWENAYTHLQDALADAGSAPKPVEIKVAQGIYKPDQSSADPNGSGDRSATFQLINGVTLKGGYAGIGEPDPNARDIQLYETILSGDLNSNDIDVNDPSDLVDEPSRVDNSCYVITGSQTEPNSVLHGFIVSGGNARYYQPYSNGGGMYIHLGSPTLIKCTFTKNSASYFGGAMYNEDSSPAIINCMFTCNSAGRPGQISGGGGMYNKKSNPTLINCMINGNWTSLYGGGMDSVDESSPTLINCMFIGNSAQRHGGGMSLSRSSPKLTYCTLAENSAIEGGGGFHCYSSSNLTLTNCTFFANSATNGSTVICRGESSSLQLTNCILQNSGNEIWNQNGSTIEIAYSNLQGGQSTIYDPCEAVIWSKGNIDADPCFADANNIDYHLKSQAGRWDPNSQSWVKDDVTSPCIDAGNPGCPVGDEPSPNGNRKNMGACGGTAEASKSPPYWRSIADTTNDWIVDSNDLRAFCDYWLQTGECLPGDFDRSRFVDSNDFAIFAGQWRQKGPGPGITYQVGHCIPIESPLSAAGESEPTRFTVTVEGQYILFEDLITANCCPDELELQMTAEVDLITIYEIEHTSMPCTCLCDYPITATFGPFLPGTYIIAVYQNSSFIGTTTVTIGQAS